MVIQNSVNATGLWKLIATTSISGTPATVSFTSGINIFNTLMINFTSVVASAGAQWFLGLSTNGGSTYAVSGTTYCVFGNISSGATTSAPIQITNGGGLSTNAVDGWITIENPNLTFRKTIQSILGEFNNAGELFSSLGQTAGEVQANAIQLSLGAGHFNSGTINIYGK